MKFEDLKPAQQDKLKALMRSYFVNTAWHGIRHGALFFVANLLISLINTQVQSRDFLFVGFLLNFFFLFRSFIRSLSKESDRIKEEAKKILESK
jgi:hypothetical protein